MSHILLVLRPQKQWGIVAAELKRVASLGRFMMTQGTMRSCQAADSGAEPDMIALATTCEELQTGALYSKFANKKKFRHEADFWAATELTVRQYVKKMADQKVIKAVQLAHALGIPILYAPTEKAPLHIEEQLTLQPDVEVTPIMNFTRHDKGTTYRLQLRIGQGQTITPAQHRLTPVTYEPGLFALDNKLMMLGHGFSGQLLLPFVTKETVDIPRHMENDYFRRFILKNVTKAEINAEGFDIVDVNEQLLPRLSVERSIDALYLLTLQFSYGDNIYTTVSKSRGRVSLSETANGFRFTRQLRDSAKESHYVEVLRKYDRPITANGSIKFDTLAEMIAWMRHHGNSLRKQGFKLTQPSDNVYYIGPLSVEQSDKWTGDWLQTNVTIVLNDGQLRIPFLNLRDTILRGEKEYMLSTGERLLIPDEWLSRYSSLLLTATPKDKGFVRHRSQLTSDQPTTPTKPTTPTVQPPKQLKANLRPYQLEGFQWLWGNFEARTGCCLSDEMGLGKTLQTIALLMNFSTPTTPTTPTKPTPAEGLLFTEQEMSGEGSLSPTSLVVAPASVVHNWLGELKRFAPSMLVCDYTGTTAKRMAKRRTLMQCHVVITSYRTLLNDIDFFERQQFGIIVFDESQAFKNSTSQLHSAVVKLQGLHRMALSGTPVENNLGELWSLMSVLNPNLLGSSQNFQRSFVMPIERSIEQQRTQVLQRLIAPYFLKRTKEQVLNDLPERQDEVIVCPMTESQTSLYAQELSKARNLLISQPTTPTTPTNLNLLAAIQRLRHIANGEGKTNVVFEHLEQLRDTGHKVLIFSEYVSMLDKVGNAMKERGWTYDILTGHTANRKQVIDHFQNTPHCQFFLISLKAGGVGINLTAADYVFILDPWWNQAAEEQAIARAHRIGQRNAVFVYRFVSENTLEQQILTLQQRKQNLIDSVMPFLLSS
ncbi:MAG: DEAD/DEAH box helicase [Prevotella sp.]|nr:DEAD/DEAH box helicase [Prevotella sp.]